MMTVAENLYPALEQPDHTSDRTMTLDEFVRAYDEEGPFELINGEKKPIMPNVRQSTWIIHVLFRLLDAFSEKHGLGNVFMEQTFVLIFDKTHWVKGSRQPDLTFTTQARWNAFIAEYPSPENDNKPIILVPDLAVEVISPTDRMGDVLEKAEYYRQDGVKEVWVIDPIRRTIRVFKAKSMNILEEGDTLSGDDLLPGFTLNLTEFFNTPLSKKQPTQP